jgi:predicted nucleic acid-binding protein
MDNNYLIDTNIIIDALHNNTNAISFIEGFDIVNISVITYVELLYGCMNKRELTEMQKLLSTYNVEQINEDISLMASKAVGENYLKHGLLMDDALIGCTCLHRGYILATRDKHFAVVEGLKMFVPY